MTNQGFRYMEHRILRVQYKLDKMYLIMNSLQMHISFHDVLLASTNPLLVCDRTDVRSNVRG